MPGPVRIGAHGNGALSVFHIAGTVSQLADAYRFFDLPPGHFMAWVVLFVLLRGVRRCWIEIAACATFACWRLLLCSPSPRVQICAQHMQQLTPGCQDTLLGREHLTLRCRDLESKLIVRVHTAAEIAVATASYWHVRIIPRA